MEGAKSVVFLHKNGNLCHATVVHSKKDGIFHSIFQFLLLL